MQRCVPSRCARRVLQLLEPALRIAPTCTIVSFQLSGKHLQSSRSVSREHVQPAPSLAGIKEGSGNTEHRAAVDQKIGCREAALCSRHCEHKQYCALSCNMRYCLQHSCLQSHLPGPALAALQRRGCWHSGPSARPLTRLAAKRSATREVNLVMLHDPQSCKGAANVHKPRAAYERS